MDNQSARSDVKLDRPIGLIGGITLVVGGIIGMGIYALIAPIAANAGGALWLAFTIAIIISIVGVIPLIQIASAIPRAGAGYLFISRLLSPLWGTIASYWAILGGACSTCMVCIGLSGYIQAYWDWGIGMQLEITLLSLIIPAIFFILFLFRLRLANWLQIVLAGQLLLALLLYAIPGSVQPGHPLQFSLSLPQGMTGLIMATILCYSTCMGFQIIAEMGEEIKNPRQNIPLALVIGGAIVLLLYILIGTVFVSNVPYNFDAIISMKSPLIDTAKGFFPAGVISDVCVAFIVVGALSAALTSLNAAAIALPREFLAQSRDELLPKGIGQISRRTLTPIRAVGIYFLLVIVLSLLQFIGIDIDFYGVMAAVGILLMTVVMAIAAVELPEKHPENYRKAYFRIPKAWLIVIAVVSAITNIAFIALALLDYKNMIFVVGIFIGITLLAILYYYVRTNWLKKQGIDWGNRTKQITGFEE